MKVVFLDIDGVLNSSRTCVAHGGYPHNFTPEHEPLFDRTAVALVRGIVKAAGAKVVLSSAWRHDFTSEQAAKGLDMPIIDKTPSLLGERGLEIKDWLDRHPEVECYAIIDDSGDMLGEQMPFFVHTDTNEGFMWRDAEKLASILGIKVYDAAPSQLRKQQWTLAWDMEDRG